MSNPQTCYNPGYNYINQNCGLTTISLDGCICIVNYVSGSTAASPFSPSGSPATSITLKIDSTAPAESSGTYTSTGVSSAFNGFPGGGALVSTSFIPGYFSCYSEDCSCVSLTVRLDIAGSVVWYATLCGKWGETLTATAPGTGTWSGRFQATLCLNTVKQDCEGCSIYKISGGRLVVN